MHKAFTITVAQPKPRHPFAIAARRRSAGAHRRSPGGLRQTSKRHLQAELAESTHPPPVR